MLQAERSKISEQAAAIFAKRDVMVLLVAAEALADSTVALPQSPHARKGRLRIAQASSASRYVPFEVFSTRPAFASAASHAIRASRASGCVNGSMYPPFRARSQMTVQWRSEPGSSRKT